MSFQRFDSLEELYQHYPKKEKHWGKDYTGQKYNRLTFISRIEHPDKKQSYWAVRCNCGKYFAVRASAVVNNITKSCGCLNAELTSQRAHDMFFRDLTGQKFGKLTVITFAGRDKNHHSLWKCQCECGKITIVSTSNLTTGHTMSCGCNKQSNGELRVERWLQEHKWHYEKEVSVPELGRQRFDFKIYIGDIYVFLEIQGIQHYQPVKHFGGEEAYQIRIQHDQDKANYCKERNIPLIILYSDKALLQNLEQQLSILSNDYHSGE